jgi:hypothetical protein
MLSFMIRTLAAQSYRSPRDLPFLAISNAAYAHQDRPTKRTTDEIGVYRD